MSDENCLWRSRDGSFLPLKGWPKIVWRDPLHSMMARVLASLYNARWVFATVGWLFSLWRPLPGWYFLQCCHPQLSNLGPSLTFLATDAAGRAW